MLMLLNRVSNAPKAIQAYNSLLEKYIAVLTSETTTHETKPKQIPLYVSFIIG